MVKYFEIIEVPGVQMFRCDKLHAQLNVASCAQRWVGATRENKERLALCKNCPTGALHAGETAASNSSLRGLSICARCHEMTNRLITKHLCVSCYNRQREIIIGKNARGTVPTRLAALDSRVLRYQTIDGPSVLHTDHSLDMTELIVTVLRNAPNTPTFAFHGTTCGIPQLRLF
jgi:hypothetical protein